MSAPLTRKVLHRLISPHYHYGCLGCNRAQPNVVAQPNVAQPNVRQPILQLVRHKGGKRFKAPTEAKDKRWIAQKKKYVLPNLARKIQLLDEKLRRANDKVPVDDVWFKLFYSPTIHDFNEAIEMHREFADPSMLDNMEGLVQVTFRLDFTTSKKTKFIKRINNIVAMPHWFDDGNPDNRVIAFSKDPALHEVALQEGAIQAGGSDIISQIENGLINNSDFDHVVCTPDIVTDLVPIRKILRDTFPMQPKGSLGLDMKEMVHRFTKGKTFNSFPGDSEAEGFLTVTIGRLDMATQQLHANLEAYVKAIASMKPGGRFILNSVMTCHPSPEIFPIKIDDLLPEVKRKVKAKKAKDTKDNEDIKDNENVGESSVNEEKAAIASAS